MKNNCLYSTRMVVFDGVFLFWIVAVLGAFFIHFILGVLVGLSFISNCIRALTTRVYVFDNRIEYKTGFILSISKRTILFRSVSAVDYSSGLIGKCLNYGNVIVYGYNDGATVNIRNVKNARMLVSNIQELLAK